MTTDTSDKRERAKRLATDYSASQRERDNQDRARGEQKRGTVTEAGERIEGCLKLVGSVSVIQRRVSKLRLRIARRLSRR